MSNFWSVRKNYLAFRQLAMMTGVLLTGLCFAQTPLTKSIKRAPASYVPDDDVIVKPVNNELSFYQQYIGNDNSNDVVNSRNQIQIWQKNQQFADAYGMNTRLAGSPYFVPTPEEKWEYFKDRYLRYLRRKGEQPIKDTPKNWYQEYRASNEVDTIDEIEGRFKSSNKSSGSSAPAEKNILPSSLQAKEVSLWKGTKFIFQPRVDQGIILVGFRGSLGYARAWVGVNGRTEMNYQKNFDKSGTRLMYNYYTDTGEYFTSVDQRITENVYARYTSSKNPLTEIKDDTLMLLYAKTF